MSQPPVLKTIPTGSLQIVYEEGGQTNGKPVVLLHGFPDDPRAWDGVVGPLIAEGFRTIVPYLRGYGSTGFLSSDAVRNGQQSVLAVDVMRRSDRIQRESPWVP